MSLSLYVIDHRNPTVISASIPATKTWIHAECAAFARAALIIKGRRAADSPLSTPPIGLVATVPTLVPLAFESARGLSALMTTSAFG